MNDSISDINRQKQELQTMELQTSVTTPDQLLAMAVQQGADIDKLEKLMALQERWDANEARKAYIGAITAFKNNPPEIFKNKHVDYNDYNHATLDNVVDSITKGLSENGLSHRWDIAQDANQVTVTCVITHQLGHSESVPLSAPHDTSGKKNSIQAIASTISYLQRYTLLAATGCATKEMDNDGYGAPQSQMNPEPLRMGRVAEAYKAFKDVIDEDVDVMDHVRVQEGWSRLTNDEQIAVHNMFGGDKPEGCKKGYKAIVKELLAIKGD